VQNVIKIRTKYTFNLHSFSVFLHFQCLYCCNLSFGVVLNVRFTTNGMFTKNNTHIYVAQTGNNTMIAAYHLCCRLLPQCEALRTCRSGFPIATIYLYSFIAESWSEAQKLESCKCARMRLRCANDLAVLRSCAPWREHCQRFICAFCDATIVRSQQTLSFYFTGTPIQNSIKDLYSLVSFLGLEPFTERSWWRRIVERPLKNGEKAALK